MKALSKEQIRERADLVTKLREKHESLTETIEVFNAALTTHQKAVEEALQSLNGVIVEGKDWLEGISQEQSDYYEDKSEKWQEGENGQNYDAWKELYENVSGTDELTIEFPDPLEVPDCELPDELENLPDEP
jgi:predicted nuclease with TOPRIM domain